MWSGSAIHGLSLTFDLDCVQSRFLLSLTAGVTYHLRVLKCLETGKAQKEVGVSVWVSVMDLSLTFDLDCVQSRFLLSLTAGVTYHLRVLKCLETGKAQKEVGVSVWVSVMDLLREERVNHTIYSPLFLCEIVEIRTIRSNYRHFGCHGDHNYF